LQSQTLQAGIAFAMIGAVSVITAIACESSSQTPDHDRSSAAESAVCVRGPTSTAVVEPDKLGTPLAPDLRPDSTRMAEIDEKRAQRFDAINQLIASGCDPRTLPMVAVSHLDGLPPYTLDEALDKADLVVTAHVTSTTFSIRTGASLPVSESTLSVDVTLKGRAPSEITLYQGGGPLPDNGGIIGYFKGEPVLLRGDEVLLVAQTQTNSVGYRSVYPVGMYYVRAGVISVPDGNPCDWLNGRSLSDVLRLVRGSLSRETQDAEQPCNWSRF
jgi:hypothetical protein